MSEEQNRTYDAQYLLRLTSDMRDRIKSAAAENNRSMNAEIIATLELTYPDERPEQKLMDTLNDALRYLSAVDETKRKELHEAAIQKVAENALEKLRKIQEDS